MTLGSKKIHRADLRAQGWVSRLSLRKPNPIALGSLNLPLSRTRAQDWAFRLSLRKPSPHDPWSGKSSVVLSGITDRASRLSLRRPGRDYPFLSDSLSQSRHFVSLQGPGQSPKICFPFFEIDPNFLKLLWLQFVDFPGPCGLGLASAHRLPRFYASHA